MTKTLIVYKNKHMRVFEIYSKDQQYVVANETLPIKGDIDSIGTSSSKGATPGYLIYI